MKTYHTETGDTVILHISEQLDFAIRDSLFEYLKKIIKPETLTLAIDLTKTEFLDSTGLSIILSMYKKAAENNIDFVLFGMNRKIQSTFEIVKPFSSDLIPILSEEEFKEKYV